MALADQLGAIDPADVADDTFRQSMPDLPAGRVDPGQVADRLFRDTARMGAERRKPKPTPTAPAVDLSKYGEVETDLSKYGEPEAPAPEPAPEPTPAPKPGLLSRAGEALKGMMPDTSAVPRPGLSLGAKGTPPDTEPKPNPENITQPLDDVPLSKQEPFRKSVFGTLGALSPDEAKAAREKRVAEATAESAAATEQRQRAEAEHEAANRLGPGNIKRGRANYLPNPVPSAIKAEGEASRAEMEARAAPAPTMTPLRNAADRFAGAVLEGVRSSVRGLAELSPARIGATIDQVSAATKKLIAESFPGDRAKEKDLWSSQVAQGAGSSVPFMVMGLAGKAAGLGDEAVTGLIALTGASQQAGSEVEKFDDAIKSYRSTLDGLAKAKTPEELRAAFGEDRETLRKIVGPAEYDRLAKLVETGDHAAMKVVQQRIKTAKESFDSVALRRMAVLFANAAIGTSEALPIANALERINALSGNAVTRIAKAGAVNSFEEFIQEIGQQVGQNTVQAIVYDKAQDIFEGVADAGKVAAIIGLFQGAGIQAYHEAMGGMGGANARVGMPPPGSVAPPMPSTGGPGPGPGPGTSSGAQQEGAVSDAEGLSKQGEALSAGPKAPSSPVTADHIDAIDDAVRASGTDPATIDHADLAHAAEIHAREGLPPDEAFLTAVMRGLIKDGHINEQEARDAVGPEVEDLLVAAGESRGKPSAQAAGAAARGAAAEAEAGVREGGGQDRGPTGGEREAAVGKQEGAAAGGAAGGRGTEGPAASRERTAGARGEQPGREGAGRGAGEHGREARREAAGDAGLIGEPVASLPEHNVTGADGKAVRVRPVVVDASKLITSWNPGYLKALQPRQRDRAASQAQVREIATRLDPERLGYSAEADRGAPIVGPDRMVESGNGRIAALRMVYRAKAPNGDKYREWLKGQGVDIAKFKEPVLVRQRVTDLEPHERIAFTVAANQSATLSMSAPERAMADARNLTPQMVGMIEDPDNLGAAANRGFVRAFVASIPASERGAVTAAGGALSAEGLTRARNAVLARAYGDADVLARVMESTDDDIRSISNALVLAAPEWAKFIADIGAGRVRPDLDVTPELMEAVRQTADLRARGQKLEAYLRQKDAFDTLPGPVETFMRMFYDPAGRRAAGAPRIAEALRFYAEQAAKVTTDPRFDLGTQEVTADEIQRAALAKGQDQLQGKPGAGARHGARGVEDRAQAAGSEPRARGAEADGREQPGPGGKLGLASPANLFGEDTGADGKRQRVIPGAERISPAELARRRAAAPLRPRAAQKPADVGLFGETAEQGDLLKAVGGEPTTTAKEASHGREAVRPGSPPVPPGKPARRAQVVAGAPGRPDQLSLFGGEAGAGAVPGPAGADEQRAGGAEPAVSPEGLGVTKPPTVGGRDRARKPDLSAAQRAAASGLKAAREKIAERSRLNYRITDDDHIGEGGPKQKVRGNLDAIRVLKTIEDESRQATPDEKKLLVKYVGWGAFAQDVFASHKPEWKPEREALRSLLSDAEYEAAKGSTLNAHFTSPDVVRGMWDALDYLGFKGGIAIEPSAGAGHFIGLIPDKFAPKTAWTAVELDPITGRIAKALYAGSEVHVQGYEDLKRPSNYYDLAISNVPFGDYNITEKPYGSFPIHDFFFVKSLDKVRPGGVVAFITSRYTMDRVDAATRRMLARTADLVGAIRLPGGRKGAFAGNAGTEVTTDIIFLRKKVPGERQFPSSPWLDTREINTQDGPVRINEYFADQPPMMLGEMRLIGSMYGKNEPVLIGEADGIRERIAAAARAGMEKGAMMPRGEPAPEALPTDETQGVKDGAFFMKGDKLYQRRVGQGFEQSMSADDHDRVKRLVGIRDIVNDLLGSQVQGPGANPRAAAAENEALRAKLRKAYDGFVRTHGPINLETSTVTSRLNKSGEPVVITKQPNIAKFLPDPDAWKVAAIESYDRDSGKATPADIQTKDVIDAPRRREINSPADALATSLDDTGGVDLDHIAQSLGVDSPEAAASALGDLIYLNPDGRTWQTAGSYLAGDVVKKLEEARAIAQEDKTYDRNVSALEKVQPTPLTRADITAQFGAPWVPPEVYEDFFKEALGASSAKVRKVPGSGEWKVGLGAVSRDAQSKYATDRMSIDKIAKAAMNNEQVTVWDTFEEDGAEKRVINHAATEAARIRTESLREAFSGDHETGVEGWVWGDNDRAMRLEAIYNRTYNNLVPQRFDGSHLTLHGLNPKFSDRQHRKDAVWRMIQRGNTLLDHVVGSGKTVTMIAGGMEMRRLGLINKPAYVIPNHMLEQFSREFIEAYPNAKILVAQKDEMTRDNRKEFLAKASANDWDGIVITHDAFGRINMAVEWRKDFIRDQLSDLERIMRAEAAEDGKNSQTVKALEKAKKRLQGKLDKLLNEERKDDGTSFEESGIDHLFIDEAHCFPYDTMVTTDRGPMKIGDIVERRMAVLVASFNHETGQIVWRRVHNHWKYRRDDAQFAIVRTEELDVCCTVNHQIFVDGRGDVRADEIHADDTLLALPKELRSMRADIPVPQFREEEQRQAQILRQSMRVYVADGSAWTHGEINAEDARGDQQEMERGCRVSGAHGIGVLGAHEAAQPYAVASNARQDAEVSCWPHVSGERRQWPADKAATASTFYDEAADRVSDQHEASARTISIAADLLQGRPSGPCPEVGHRDRRQQPSAAEVEVFGSAEDRDTCRARVVSVEILERGSDREPCRGDRTDSYVYDLGIEGEHNYFANGILVHNSFKNLAFITRMQRVKGLSQGDSQRAEDLFLKIRYLEQKRPGRSAVFATGTPVSNTMAELWTMQRYLQLEALRERDLDTFDNWAQTFGRVVNNMELSADGRTLKEVSSFSKFVNVPELISLYSEIADTKTADMLNLPTPKVQSPNGTPGIEIVQAEPSPAEEEYIQGLVKLAEEIKGKRPEPGQPNMLSVVTMGRKVATDGRLVGIDDVNPMGKISLLVKNVYDIWKSGTEPGLVQMVFLDMGVPQSRSVAKARPAEDDDGSQAANEAPARVDLYADIKRRLIAMGIPAKQIAAIHDASDDAKKAKLFAAARAAGVRVLLGSTGKMGVGTNAQTRLIALHHADAPWKPAELKQRDGRIERQGNLNPSVRILRYVTKRSFDAFMWQKLDTKAKFIGQVLSGAKGSRHAEDIDNPLPEAAEMKAAASGDPRIMERAEIERQVRQYAAQKRAFDQVQARASWERGSAKSALDLNEKELPLAKADAAKVQDIAGDRFAVELGGQQVTKRADAGRQILDRMLALAPAAFYAPKLVNVGTMSGFDMNITVQSRWTSDGAYLVGSPSLKSGDRGYSSSAADITFNEQTDPAGIIRRFENILANIREQPARAAERIARERDNLARIEKTLKETWPRERDYRAAKEKLDALTKAMRDGEKPPTSDKLAESSPRFGAEADGEERYVGEAMANLMATSRTAQGTVDVSSGGAAKAVKMAEGLTGERAASSAKSNFENVIRALYSMRNDMPLDGPEMAVLIDDVARRVNAGIVKPGELMRSHEVPGRHTPVADLPEAHAQFSAELARRLSDPNADPVETAAFIEWRANIHDHFWSDGVGKTSKALAAVPLMRAGLPLPKYPPSKEFFSYAKGTWEAFNAFYHGLIPGQHERAFIQNAVAAIGPDDMARALAKRAKNDFLSPMHDPADVVNGLMSVIADIRARPTTVPLMKDPDRVAMHEATVDRLYRQRGLASAVESAPASDRRVDIVIGPPAAGKSMYVADPLMKEHGAVLIDADEAKIMLPEFDGGLGAGAVHEESAYIAEELLAAKAIAMGDNIVQPLIGKNLRKIDSLITSYKEVGYDVHVHFVDLDIKKAQSRAIIRYIGTGRLLDPAYIESVDHLPDKTFEAIKARPDVSSYERISTDVPFGAPARIIDVGGAPQTYQGVGGGRAGSRTEGVRQGEGGHGLAERRPRFRALTAAGTRAATRWVRQTVAKMSEPANVKHLIASGISGLINHVGQFNDPNVDKLIGHTVDNLAVAMKRTPAHAAERLAEAVADLIKERERTHPSDDDVRQILGGFSSSAPVFGKSLADQAAEDFRRRIADIDQTMLVSQASTEAENGPTSARSLAELAAIVAAMKPGSRQWVDVPEGRIYLRIAYRPEIGATLEIPNIEFETRGTGAFTRYLSALERAAAAKNLDAVYVEQLFNPRLDRFLRRHGYRDETRAGGALLGAMTRPDQATLYKPVDEAYQFIPSEPPRLTTGALPQAGAESDASGVLADSNNSIGRALRDVSRHIGFLHQHQDPEKVAKWEAALAVLRQWKRDGVLLQGERKTESELEYEAALREGSSTSADLFRQALRRKLAGAEVASTLQLRPDLPSGQQAQAFVIERGRATGDEHYVAISADGDLFDQSRGTPNQINFTQKLSAAARDPANAIVLHHNHPNDKTVSAMDVAMLALPGITAVWAHGNGQMVTRVALTPEMRVAWRSFDPDNAVRKLYQISENIGNWAFRGVLQGAIDARMITQGQGNHAYDHLIQLVLARAGVTDYRTSIDMTALIADLNLEPHIDRAARAVRAQVFRGQAYRDDRPAGALQHPGDMGATFDRTAAAPGKHAAAAGNDRDSGAGDRPKERARRTDRAGQLRLPGVEESDGLGLAASGSRFSTPPPGAAAGGAGAGTPPPPGGGGGGPGGAASPGASSPAEQAILSRIVPSEVASRLPKDFNEIYTMAKDDLWPIAVVEKEMSGGRRLPVEQSPYKQARLTRGSSGKAEQFLKYGTFDFNTLENNGPSLRAALKPVENSLDGWRAYAVARRAIEKEAQGVKTGVPLPEARQVVAASNVRHGPAFVAVRAYQDRVIDYMQQSGLLSADGVAAMRQVNHDYVPFYRAMGADKEFGRQLGGGLKTRDPIKKMKGSERQIIDPIESIVKDTYLFISLAERNRALQALEDLALGSTVGNQFMERVKTKMAPIKVSPDEINRHLRGEGITEEVSDTMMIFRPQPFRPQPDEIAIWRDGKRRVYKVGKDVAEAVNALDRDALNIVTRILAVPAKMLRAGAVLSPEFIARNPVRDQFSAIAFSESGYRPIVDLVQGLGHLFKKDDVFQDWLKGGGAGAAMVALDRDYISNNVVRLTKPTWAKRGWHVIRSPFEALRVLSETFENASRLGEMHRARGAGKSRMTGAFDARELTLDFARMGAQTKSINAVIPFWNAQAEGVDRGFRAFGKNPLRTLFKVALSITLPSILLWLVNHDDDRYKELPAWEKDYFWHIITDNWVNITPAEAAKVPASSKRQVGGQWMQNKGTIWKIPKPFELGVLFGSVPERVLDAFFTDHPHAFRGLADSIMKALLPNWLPQVAIPFIEQFANRSTFTDRSLVPKYLEGVLPKYQAQPFTSETAQVLGNLISKISENTSFASPIVIDNFIRQWTGGLGAHAVSLVDKGIEAAGLAKDRIKPAPTLSDIPVIKGFVSRYPSANSQSVQEFYDTYEKRKRAADTIKYLQKTGENETAAQERDNRAINTAETMHKAMSNQFKFIRGVYLDKKMTPNEKRQIIDATYLQVIEIAKRGNELFKKTEMTPRERRRELEKAMP